MRRDLINVLLILLASSVVAAATNVFGHKMEWIRRPLNEVVEKRPTSSQAAEPPGGAGNKEGSEQSADTGGKNGGSTQLNHTTASSPQQGDVVEADEVLSDLANGTACFIDAREPTEYAAGHLRGAINIPPTAIYEGIDKLRAIVPPDHRLIVYCGGSGCEASRNVSDALRRDADFRNVFVYEKGWEEISSSDHFKEWIVVGD